ncbi:winged helix-turn-helix domain-containing protein [Streptomyces griseoluteus]|uniref:Winged helix-turn-helix domain-containing protein n=1 Tax=Streptomyces griseoluteus TaxID=29306 RepID=A0A4Z1CZ72_STRGP|nr:winged helix-turn-helix domain-containing protein [Streptomyces griseoluteus]
MPHARGASVTREDGEALAALLDESARQGRTWTAAAWCDWLAAERGVRVSAAWLTEALHRHGFRWKRPGDTLRHKADPVLQQAARAQLGARAGHRVGAPRPVRVGRGHVPPCEDWAVGRPFTRDACWSGPTCTTPV